MNVESQSPFYTSPHSIKARVLRVLWQVVWAVLFVPSPRPFHGWRQFLLRVFGARIGKGNHFYPTCRIPEPWKIVVGNYSCVGPGALLYASGGISIGSYVTVSQYAHICTSSHDYNDPAMRQTFAPVLISDRAWICADAFVGPGVTIHRGAVIGARAVVTKDVGDYAIVGGVPAEVIKYRFGEDIIERLLGLKWWEWPKEKVKKYIGFFQKDVTAGLLDELEEATGLNE